MRSFISTVSLLLFSYSAYAVPVLWELPPGSGQPYTSYPSYPYSDNVGIWGVGTGGGFDLKFQLSGSFVYDADTNLYSDVDLVLDDGWRAITSVSCSYGDEATSCPDQYGVTFAYIGEYNHENYSQAKEYYQLNFDAPLTNAGGEVSLFGDCGIPGYCDIGPRTSKWMVCDGLVGCVDGIATENAIWAWGGNEKIIGSVVPVPAAVWLFGSALAGLGFMRRRQTA